jgi:UDP:flavonoid glycosyltransferase YjiC (YdhE family)
MKALLTILPAASHLHPMLGVADALARGGHEILFATSAPFCPDVERAGFRAVPVGADWRVDRAEEAFPILAAAPRERLSEAWFVDLFADVVPRASLASLAGAIARHTPDVIVRDLYDFAAPLAAERAGVPCATLAFGHHTPAARLTELVGDRLAALRDEAGLPVDETLGWLHRWLYLDFVPPRFQAFSTREIATAHCFRPSALDALGRGAPLGWLDALSPGLTAWVTLGTVFNRSPALFPAAVDGLRALCRNIVVTVGESQDPAAPELRALGGGAVRVERFVALSHLVPRCDLVVCHGGFNTVMGALAHGRPVLCLPEHSDDPYNGARCAELGVGLTIAARAATRERVFEAARRLLAEPGFREAAGRFAGEMAALPSVDEAAARVVRLATERRAQLR